MSNTTEQTQAQLVSLKARLFDAQEAAAYFKGEVDQFNQTLSQIVQLAGIDLGTQEGVTHEVLIEKFKERFAAPGECEESE